MQEPIEAPAGDERDGPRPGQSIYEWMAEEQARMLEEAFEQPRAYLAELVQWIEEHPEATFEEREAAHQEIRAKYPRLVEFDRKNQEWEDWQSEHPFAEGRERDLAYWDIFGFERDEDEDEEEDEEL